MKKIVTKNDPSKNVFSTREMILVGLTTLLVGLVIGILLNKTKIITKSAFVEDEYLNEFATNYQYIIDNYYEKVDKKELINGAIAGMANSLGDPFSMYIDESTLNNFSATLNGSYNGIGIQIVQDSNKNIIVTGVFKDSPAEKAEIKVKDKLLEVNGKTSEKLGLSGMVNEIRNSEKKEILIKLERDGQEQEITVTKSTVVLSSVESKTFDVENKKVGYILISVFANNTYSQFKKELQSLEEEGINYLIIDVRGNSGGKLSSIDSILDLFLNSKQIMYQMDEKGKITKTYGTGNEKKDYEIILLGDENSASASEVLIAGIKENLNSKFIGKKTYGKGTVQELKTLSQYKITIKKWLTPKGNWINKTEGIIPDIEVDLDEKYFDTYEDNDDTQLQRVLEYVRTGQ